MKPRSFGTVIERYLFIVGVMIIVLLLNSVSYAATDSPVDRLDNPIEHSESFSFVVLGHPKVADGKPVLHFEEILNRITELKADFVIVTGDVINGMWGKRIDPEVIRGDWDRFDKGVKRLGILVYRLPGNHDVHNFATRDIYLERYPAVPYSFAYRGSRFIL